MRLTETEKKTVRLALTGLAYREIASITETTTQVIKNRMKDVFDKTGAGSRSELIGMVLVHPEWVDGERCGECGRMR
jgi:DNA-binding CsgD family transcriptional regulator